MILNIPHDIYATLDNKNLFNVLMNYQGVCYREQPGRKTSRITIAGKDYFIKQHSGVGYREIIKNLLRGRLPVVSAKNEWQALQKCQTLGIKTAPLVGYGALGLNPASQHSFVLMLPLENMQSLEHVMQHDLPFAYKRKIINALAHTVRTFHQAGMCHRDMYLCHFLLGPEQNPELYVMDLHRVTIREKITPRDQLKDLAALLYSSLDCVFSTRDYLYFLKIYMNKPLKQIIHDSLLNRIIKKARAVYRRDYGYEPRLPIGFPAPKAKKQSIILNGLYSCVLTSLMPFIFLRLYWRGRMAPDYRQRILERCGYYSKIFNQSGICLHAVSVGELMAARPLILKIQTQLPDVALTITTTTPTASKQVKHIFGDSVQHVYIPYDYNGAVNRFLKAFSPRLMIVMETEIWPNLFYALNKQNIPLIMINARLAEKSLRGYKKLKFFFAPILHSVSCIAAQSAMDATHFKQLGALPEQVRVMGNLKYDVAVPQHLVERAKGIRAQWNRTVWIASSTHAAEEDLIIATAIAVKKQQPDSLCIIAPRHPERFQAVAEKCKAQGLNTARHSLQEKTHPDTDILLADTLGELYFFYALSDVAVVCGSFAPIGGHNILEPAILKLPIIVGPQMFHFKTILADFLQKNALVQINNSEALLIALLQLLGDKIKAQHMGARAYDLVLANQGAVEQAWQTVVNNLHLLVTTHSSVANPSLPKRQRLV